MNAQLTEIMRLITNLIRTGTVSDVDTVNWLCRVKTGELETNWINWLTCRAGKTRTWWLSIQLARGRADLYTEMPVKVSGFKQQIDAGEWIVTTLTHSLSAENGYTTSIELSKNRFA